MCKAATSIRKNLQLHLTKTKKLKRGPVAANYAQAQVKDVNATY
jgi:hypothetical protein